MSYELTGRITTVLVAFAGFFIVLVIGACVLEHLIDKWRDRVRWNAVREFGARIHSASWWFEHAAARRALRLLADATMKDGGFDPDQLREAWRREMAQENEKTKAAVNR